MCRRQRSPSPLDPATRIRLYQSQMSMWSQLMHCKKKENDLWLSATKTKNYLMEDPFIDWLDLHGRKSFSINDDSDADLKILFEKGEKFESKILDELKHEFANDYVIVNTTGKEGNNEQNFNKTKEYMTACIPIIAQAVLFNHNNNTFGTADLIVRSNYLNKLVKHPVLSNEEITIKAPNLKKYHYRVIDIKWSTLPLRANSDALKNKDRFPAYKSQIAIYNCALGAIQGYTPPQAYILGKGWLREKNKEKIYGCDARDLLGIIDYANIDSDIIEKTADALIWYREVAEHGHKWSPYDPPEKKHRCLFPNMTKDDSKWSKVKMEIALKTDEVTLICNVGKKYRDQLHSRKIYSFMDPECNSHNMGLGAIEGEIASKINNICDINRGTVCTKGRIYPRTIHNNDYDWQTEYATDMYFDYETMNVEFVNTAMNIHDTRETTCMTIFMIGLYYKQGSKWEYESFVMHKISENEEMECMDKFTNFVLQKAREHDQKNKSIRLFHWSHAEVTGFNKINERYNGRWTKWSQDITFVDMMKVFQKEGLAIKGAFNYSLKSIGNALFKMRKINTVWPDTDISNGKIASFRAAQIYRNWERNIITVDDSKTFNDIIEYNKIDCQMIWEIVSYFRKHHSDTDS